MKIPHYILCPSNIKWYITCRPSGLCSFSTYENLDMQIPLCSQKHKLNLSYVTKEQRQLNEPSLFSLMSFSDHTTLVVICLKNHVRCVQDQTQKLPSIIRLRRPSDVKGFSRTVDFATLIKLFHWSLASLLTALWSHQKF